jgi:hypothetical protein
MATNDYKSPVRVVVVSDDMTQTEGSCHDFAYVRGASRELVQFGASDVNSINGTFPLIQAYAFLDKFAGEDDDECTMVGIVDFANTKAPEFAQFMFGYLLAQNIYCYAIGIDEKQARDMRVYVQSMCKENEACSDSWKEAMSSIDFGEPSSYLLCGIAAASFDSRSYKTVIHVGASPKRTDLLICAILSCYDPVSGNPVMTKSKADGAPIEIDEEEYNSVPDALIRTVIFNL